ncbi:MAG: hypothetical protein ACUVTD_07535 [Nitrososphaerales archaeon]
MSKSRIIPFPLVYIGWGAVFYFDRETTKDVLRSLEKKGDQNT